MASATLAFFALAVGCLAGLGGCGARVPVGVDGAAPPDATRGATTPADRAGSATDHPGEVPAESTAGPIQFVDRAPRGGFEFQYRNGEEAGAYAILESLGGGVALLDYDNDGWLDALFPGGGQVGPGRLITGNPSCLVRQVEPWSFTDVSRLALPPTSRYTHGVAVADYNHDGFADVLITGYGGLQLLRNAGDGTLHDVTSEARLDDGSWSSSAAWADLNGDSHLDLYVAHYVDWSLDHNPVCPDLDGTGRDVCSPRQFGPLADVLYAATGDGAFHDVSRASGLRRDGKGLGVLAADLDCDGDVDIYVANDTEPNFLYRNDGAGRLTEIGAESGTALGEMGTPDGSMGVALLDDNRDGWPDVWVANFERESFALYRNHGGGLFHHASHALGITRVGATFVGFGTVAADFDRDGFEDLFVSNGHILHHPRGGSPRQRPLLFHNRQGRDFEDVAPRAGSYLSSPHAGRGVAVGDIDNDGDLDLALAPCNERVALLDNVMPLPGQSVRLRLIGTQSNRDAIGARLTLHASSGRQYRHVYGGGSYLSHSERLIDFGLPSGAQVQSLTVVWPSGAVQQLATVATGRVTVVVEPPGPAE